MNIKCCTGDCNQGRGCPAKARREQPPYVALILIVAVSWLIATAFAVTIDSAGGKLAHAQIHPTSCGAC
jgi:hypothetical protein